MQNSSFLLVIIELTPFMLDNLNLVTSMPLIGTYMEVEYFHHLPTLLALCSVVSKGA
jgi:hypothetical protein